MAKVAVVGSRGYGRWGLAEEVLNALPDDTVIISGGAKGPDTLAVEHAKLRGMEYQVFKADWIRYGKGAGFIRNGLIVDACDMVIAFWDKESKGTKHTIDLARKKGKMVLVF